ncbi:MAG: GNAT family N-acetyltransferase [Lachnospiraceae bacterium]
MLKPAQSRKDDLLKEIVSTWYGEKTMYWNCSSYDSIISLSDDNYYSHQFVSVDNKGNLQGYITYEVDRAANKTSGFGIISFNRNPMIFAADIKQAITDIFIKFGFSKIEFFAYADNPAIKTYRKFIVKYGGREIGEYKRTARLQDGKWHDGVMFELFHEDFKQHN